MKKITFLLALFVLCVTGGYAQVEIGDGTNTNQRLPMEPYYGYSYAQSIYLASDVNATGNITSIQWHFTGGGTLLPNTQDLVVYLGHTTKTSFDSTTDWVPLEDLTQVYAGGITVTTAGGWVTLTFTTPFAYNGTDNLVVAVDENHANYDSNSDNFYNTPVTGNRSIVAYSDPLNIDPAAPNASTDPGFNLAAFVPNVIFGGIQQACAAPKDIVSSNVGTTSANFTWTPKGSETAWEVVILEDGSDLPTGATVGTAVTGTPAYSTTVPLTAGTKYQFYVRANCGAAFSAWTPVTFTTLCEAFADFEENFESTGEGSVPDCWSSILTTYPGNDYANVGVVNNGSTANPVHVLSLYNYDDANATIIVSTPTLASLAAGTNRMRFRARGDSGTTLIVGTMSDRTNATTFVPVQNVALTSSYAEYYVTIPVTTNGFVAFKRGGTATYSTISIDDVFWEPLPSTVPGCISDLSAAINEECGNSATLFEWSDVEGAEGYRVSIGTSAGASDVVDNVSIGNVINYSFTGEYNTTYYYKLVPFNGAGSAADCEEGTFTTASVGCYCTPDPSYVDGNGITNVQLGDTDLVTPAGEENQWGDVYALTYYDHSDSPVNVGQGLNTNFKITYDSGTSYLTNVWVDLNNNYVFDANEIVFSGVSQGDYDEPSVLNASFIMPAGTSLGVHKMRIVGVPTYNSGSMSPCYNGYNGVSIDVAANVVVPECTPGTFSSAVVVADCANNQYFIDVTIATLGNGTPVLSDGTTTYPVTATGLMHLGPFASGTSKVFTLLHGANATCDIPVGNFTFFCPPVNDDCSGAIVLAANPDLACTAVTAGTLRAATDSGVDVPEDGFGNPINDVWYKFVATATGYRIKITDVEGSTYQYTDLVHEVFQGSCGDLVSIVQNDSNLTNLTGLTIGATYYVRIFTYSDFVGADTTFNVCLATLPGVPVNDNCDGAVALTANPAAACTTVTAGTLIAATDSGIAIPADGVGNPINDVWYTFVATAENHKITISDIDASNYAYTDLVFEVFQGTCQGTLTSMIETSNSSATLLGLTVGTTYYVRVFTEGDTPGADTTFNICLTVAPTPPSNNECVNAVVLVPGNNINSNPIITTVLGATGSTGVPVPDCGSYSGTDIWYSVVVPADGNITVQTSSAGETDNFDSGLALYSGACGNMALISCNDDTPDEDYNYSRVVLTGRTPGEVVYARVWPYNGNTNTSNFRISAFNASLSTSTFDNAKFAYYPNPVKNILNLSYTQNISDVAVFNLLGQQVVTKSVNSNNGQIDMSKLAAGAYIVKVTVDNQVKTIKVIKE